MATSRRFLLLCGVIGFWLASSHPAVAQPAPEADLEPIKAKLEQLQQAVAGLKEAEADPRLVADVEVHAKAADWILRHNEFYRPDYANRTLQALDTGLQRAAELKSGNPSWGERIGSTIRGYISKVDGSVQPYALSLPEGFDAKSTDRLPLHVVLHGRGGTLNEVSFIRQHEGKPPAAGQTWVQLDVFGRTNNAYRFAGETDVFEALDDVKRRLRIDEKRITLRGFSMGGAGAWHLGMHYPSLWVAVNPGAGFVDFYKYQNKTEKLPPYQHAALHIYDAVDYALNAHNVPVITYGGELDKQLAAGKTMVEAAAKVGVEIKLLVGPNTGHKYHPESLKETMAFLKEKSEQGRPGYPGLRDVRFITFTPKYNQCEWLTVEELVRMYEPATVEGKVGDDGTLRLKTRNVAVLQIARDVASDIEIDGDHLPLYFAADGLLPGVYYEQTPRGWQAMDYQSSRTFSENKDLRKRHNLQGPIDDAFMQPFVCVRGTGAPWSQPQQDWADWSLDRFDREFDKWMRGKIRIVDDKELTEDMILTQNLILFGDPGSNAVLAKIVDRLPVTWTEDGLEVNGKSYDPATHGLSLIYPNPLNPRRYVVVNSGHTFHERDFKASNAWLFPRLGDIAVQKFAPSEEGGYDETIEWAAMFNASWKLPREE